MRKKDITDKLTFDGNPCLIVKGKELEVNGDAPTMLRLMGILNTETPGAMEILQAYDLMFPEETKKEIETMHLSFSDLTTLIQEGIGMITGEDSEPGEQ